MSSDFAYTSHLQLHCDTFRSVIAQHRRAQSIPPLVPSTLPTFIRRMRLKIPDALHWESCAMQKMYLLNQKIKKQKYFKPQIEMSLIKFKKTVYFERMIAQLSVDIRKKPSIAPIAAQIATMRAPGKKSRSL